MRDRYKAPQSVVEEVAIPSPVVGAGYVHESKWSNFMDAKDKSEETEIRIGSFFGSIR